MRLSPSTPCRLSYVLGMPVQCQGRARSLGWGRLPADAGDRRHSVGRARQTSAADRSPSAAQQFSACQEPILDRQAPVQTLGRAGIPQLGLLQHPPGACSSPLPARPSRRRLRVQRDAAARSQRVLAQCCCSWTGMLCIPARGSPPCACCLARLHVPAQLRPSRTLMLPQADRKLTSRRRRPPPGPPQTRPFLLSLVLVQE